ncbi:helix-turn-helix transcriptional regulator [Streptomyces nigrescens]
MSETGAASLPDGLSGRLHQISQKSGLPKPVFLRILILSSSSYRQESTIQPSSRTQTAFLNLPQAAEYLGLSPNTLYVWRHRRQGPPSFRMGRRVMYRITALEEWVRTQEPAD